MVWLEWYRRRLVCTDEGNWAGGRRYRWDIATDGYPMWSTPEFEH
jgi:hypothetical protein